MRQQESANNVLHVDVLNMEWDQIRNSAKCTSRQKTNSRRFSAGRFLVIPAGARSCAERCPEHVHRHTPALTGQEVALVRGVTLCRKTPALTGQEVALVRGVTLCRKTPAPTGQEVALVRGVTLCRKTPALTGQDLFVQCITRRGYVNITITQVTVQTW